MRHGLPDAEGIADREHHVADHQLIGIGEIQRREFLVHALQPQHGKVGTGVLEHDLGLELALVRERYLDLVGALDDVDVGDDEAAIGSTITPDPSERCICSGWPGLPKKRRKIGSSRNGLWS